MNFYENYEYNRKRLDKITINQGEIPKKVNPVFFNFRKKLRMDHYEKHCPDENSTFKDVKSFFAWANETQKQYAIDKVLSSNKNKNNPNKVIYIDQNSTDQVNKIKTMKE